jgi:hypothetical protein
LWESRSPPFFFLYRNQIANIQVGIRYFFWHTVKGKIELIIIVL